MQIRLLLFAAHRELLGKSRLDLDVPTETTADELYTLVETTHPALAALRPYTTFAVNREVVEPSKPLCPGDEVAFLQPVSGG